MTYINKSDNLSEILAERIDYAFQPVVETSTGCCFGFECLLRNYQNAGFKTISDFFDSAFEQSYLFKLDLLLRKKAIEKFKDISFSNKVRLFFNLDNRIITMPDYTEGKSIELLNAHSMKPEQLCFEISEKHKIHSFEKFNEIHRQYKEQGFKIAIDDYGTGYSGLHTLFSSNTDFIKIDRFFIDNISKEPRKKLFVSNILDLAKVLGIRVIAEGVETIEDYYACREIGCQFIQGYLVQRPELDISKLRYRYNLIKELNDSDRRLNHSEKNLLAEQIDFIKPFVHASDNISSLFNCFKINKASSFIPVVNSLDEPEGVILDSDLKEYMYSPYGKEILSNMYKKTDMVKNFIRKIPVADISFSIEKILELFILNQNQVGVFITKNNKYQGVLSSSSLLKIINKKNISTARDQNPLSGLPGNSAINNEISSLLNKNKDPFAVIYFDFNNFKPFNDNYGFRMGDRVIRMFSDILRKYTDKHNFAGHIGGDDFIFIIRKNNSYEKTETNVKEIINKFNTEVESLYSKRDRDRGFIKAKDRQGRDNRFKILSVCAGILFINPSSDMSLEDVSTEAALVKKEAKQSSPLPSHRFLNDN